MPVPVLRAYASRLPRLLAERQMAEAEVAAYGQADEEGRRQLVDGWRETIRGEVQAPTPPADPAAFFAALGFEYVEAEADGEVSTDG